jgi:predicted metal-dependent HD superfamily phosphohydrolase
VRQLAVDSLAVELANWFHDAVYDPHAADNEELAKDWMSKFGAAPALTDWVGDLILATKSRDSTLQADAPLLVDVDLSIIGGAAERFWKYEEQIRMEHECVPEDISATKRREILDRFLRRKRIYSTEHFLIRYEKRARTNLIASLQKVRRA